MSSMKKLEISSSLMNHCPSGVCCRPCLGRKSPGEHRHDRACSCAAFGKQFGNSCRIVNERAVDAANNKECVEAHAIGAANVRFQPVADHERSLRRPMFKQFLLRCYKNRLIGLAVIDHLP